MIDGKKEDDLKKEILQLLRQQQQHISTQDIAEKLAKTLALNTNKMSNASA